MKAKSQWQRLVSVRVPSKRDSRRMIEFKMTILDNYPDDDKQERPTVLAVHGFPGECTDFDGLASRLHGLGIRLIAPSEIGMGDVSLQKRYVSHVDFSTPGRVEHLHALLETLNIRRIDLLLGHSAGAWAVYQAGANWDSIGSIMLVNPAGAEPNRPMKPYWIHLFWTWLLTWTILWIFAIPIATFLVRKTGFKKTKLDSRVIMTVLYTGNHDFEQVPVNATKIRERRIPMVVCFAQNDKLISGRITQNIVHEYLGIPEENQVMFLEGQNTPSRDPFFVPTGWMCRIVKFERGGHLCHKSHENEVVEQIQDLLKRSELRQK